MREKCMKKQWSFFLCIVLIVAMALSASGCNGNKEDKGNQSAVVQEQTKTDAQAETDADAKSDAQTESDTDAKSDAQTKTDADAQKDSRTENERNFHRKGYSSCVTDTGVS